MCCPLRIEFASDTAWISNSVKRPDGSQRLPQIVGCHGANCSKVQIGSTQRFPARRLKVTSSRASRIAFAGSLLPSGGSHLAGCPRPDFGERLFHLKISESRALR